MSANLVVDLQGTCQMVNTVFSGTVFAASGAVIGQIFDMINANTYCNLWVAGTPNALSGQLRLQVQTSDGTTSGSFADPTSGVDLSSSYLRSGGLLWVNSGQLLGGVLSSAVSGQFLASGFMAAAGFIRNGRYVRANVLSGDFYWGTLQAGFISNLKTTGSGGGFTLAPSSGAVSV